MLEADGNQLRGIAAQDPEGVTGEAHGDSRASDGKLAGRAKLVEIEFAEQAGVRGQSPGDGPGRVGEQGSGRRGKADLAGEREGPQVYDGDGAGLGAGHEGVAGESGGPSPAAGH